MSYSIQRVTKKLKLRAYRIRVMHELKLDMEKRLRYYRFREFIDQNEVDIHMNTVFFR